MQQDQLREHFMVSACISGSNVQQMAQTKQPTDINKEVRGSRILFKQHQLRERIRSLLLSAIARCRTNLVWHMYKAATKHRESGIAKPKITMHHHMQQLKGHLA